MKDKNMKVWMLGLAGLVGIFAIAKVAGWCPWGSCQTAPAKASAQAASSAATEQGGTFVSLEQAMSDAKSQNKVVLVDVYTEWCSWCKKLDEDVYPAPEVQKELRNYFTAVKINAESSAAHTFEGKEVTERELASGWQVTGYPTILFLTPDGKVIDQLSGYMPPKDFANTLRYVGTGAYRTMSFEQWHAAHS